MSHATVYVHMTSSRTLGSLRGDGRLDAHRFYTREQTAGGSKTSDDTVSTIFDRLHGSITTDTKPPIYRTGYDKEGRICGDPSAAPAVPTEPVVAPPAAAAAAPIVPVPITELAAAAPGAVTGQPTAPPAAPAVSAPPTAAPAAAPHAAPAVPTAPAPSTRGHGKRKRKASTKWEP
jgi:hypothetical protein